MYLVCFVTAWFSNSDYNIQFSDDDIWTPPLLIFIFGFEGYTIDEAILDLFGFQNLPLFCIFLPVHTHIYDSIGLRLLKLCSYTDFKYSLECHNEGYHYVLPILNC